MPVSSDIVCYPAQFAVLLEEADHSLHQTFQLLLAETYLSQGRTGYLRHLQVLAPLAEAVAGASIRLELRSLLGESRCDRKLWNTWKGRSSRLERELISSVTRLQPLVTDDFSGRVLLRLLIHASGQFVSTENGRPVPFLRQIPHVVKSTQFPRRMTIKDLYSVLTEAFAAYLSKSKWRAQLQIYPYLHAGVAVMIHCLEEAQANPEKYLLTSMNLGMRYSISRKYGPLGEFLSCPLTSLCISGRTAAYLEDPPQSCILGTVIVDWRQYLNSVSRPPSTPSHCRQMECENDSRGRDLLVATLDIVKNLEMVLERRATGCRLCQHIARNLTDDGFSPSRVNRLHERIEKRSNELVKKALHPSDGYRREIVSVVRSSIRRNQSVVARFLDNNKELNNLLLKRFLDEGIWLWQPQPDYYQP